MRHTGLLRVCEIGVVYVLILLVVAFLMFSRLGDRALWGDEAETATLAVNITKYGLPKTFDGANRITLFGPGVDSNAHDVWTWSPWLDEYVAAAAFRLAGVSTWTARAPFAFSAWLSVALLGAWVWRRYGRHDLAWIGMLYLGLLEPFVLHARQARYYGLVLLAQVLLLWALHDIWRQKSRGTWLLVLSLLMHFYSNYLLVLAAAPAVAGIAVVSKRRDIIARVGIGLALAAAGSLPWLVYAKPWSQVGFVNVGDFWPKARYYTYEFHVHILPWFFLGWPLVWLVQWWRDTASPRGVKTQPEPSAAYLIHRDPLARSLWLFFPAFLLTLPFAPTASLRYLLPLLPVSAVWVVLCLNSLRLKPVWTRALTLVLISSNLVSWFTLPSVTHQHALRVPLMRIVGEITHPYVDRTEAVAVFLNTHARPGGTVFVPGTDFPLIFYTPLRIVDGRLTDLTSLSELPDWILSESPSAILALPPRSLPASLTPRYEQIAIQVPDAKPGGGIPEPDIHEYRTAERVENFVLYRKRPGNSRPQRVSSSSYLN